MGMDDDLQSGLLVVGILLLLLGGAALVWGLMDVEHRTEREGILGTGPARTTTSYNEPALLVGGVTLLAGVLFLAAAGAGGRPGSAVVLQASSPPQRAAPGPSGRHETHGPAAHIRVTTLHHADDRVDEEALDHADQEAHDPAPGTRDPVEEEARKGMLLTGALLAALLVVSAVLYALGPFG